MSLLFEKLKDKKDQMAFYSRYMAGLEREKGFLASAYLQLTPLCNLSCKMCYAKMSCSDIENMGGHIMRFDEWKWFIDRFHEVGTITLNMTGGECMLHPDFEQIYNYAYDLGFEIVLFTNGTCISDRLFSLFCEKPPSSFSVTVYGGKPETYGNLCGNSSAYSIVFENIDKIIEKGFNILVKYTVTSMNIDDLSDVYQYFKQKGIVLRYQNSLLQFNSADPITIGRITVNEKEYIKAEKQIYGNDYMGDEDKQDRLFVNEMKKRYNSSKKGIKCAAGRSICHIRWDGKMTPCVSFEGIVLDPRETGMEKAWKTLNDWANDYPIIEECNNCPHLMRCPQCISLHFNDTGIPGIPSPRLCWKRNHPEQARIIEKRLIEKGLISKEELNENASKR